jgi:hypothetical protein
VADVAPALSPDSSRPQPIAIMRAVQVGGASYRQLQREGVWQQLGLPTDLAPTKSVVFDLTAPRVASAFGFGSGGPPPLVSIPGGVAVIDSSALPDAVRPQGAAASPVSPVSGCEVSPNGAGASVPQPDTTGVAVAAGSSGQTNSCDLGAVEGQAFTTVQGLDPKVLPVGTGASTVTDLKVLETAHAVFQLLPTGREMGYIAPITECESALTTDEYQRNGYDRVNSTLSGDPHVLGVVSLGRTPDPQACSMTADEMLANAEQIASDPVGVAAAVTNDLLLGNAILTGYDSAVAPMTAQTGMNAAGCSDGCSPPPSCDPNDQGCKTVQSSFVDVVCAAFLPAGVVGIAMGVARNVLGDVGHPPGGSMASCQSAGLVALMHQLEGWG